MQPPKANDPIFNKKRGEFKTAEEQSTLADQFIAAAKDITAKHLGQTEADVNNLNKTYSSPVLGHMTIIQAMEKLALCIDPSDTELFCTSQLTHALQVAEGMEQDHISDETMILAALIHDIGKLVEFAGAKPHEVNCPNEPISQNQNVKELAQTCITWNHDEFGYQIVKEHVPEHVAWLTRFHSLRFEKAGKFMSDQDREYYQKYLIPFRKYDLHTKSIYKVPSKNLYDYEALLIKYFPKGITV